MNIKKITTFIVAMLAVLLIVGETKASAAMTVYKNYNSSELSRGISAVNASKSEKKKLTETAMAELVEISDTQDESEIISYIERYLTAKAGKSSVSTAWFSSNKYITAYVYQGEYTKMPVNGTKTTAPEDGIYSYSVLYRWQQKGNIYSDCMASYIPALTSTSNVQSNAKVYTVVIKAKEAELTYCDINGHTAGLEGIDFENTTATCTSDGTVVYHSICTVCGETFTTRTEENARLVHEYDDATCSHLATCINCGATTGELLLHTEGQLIEHVDAQCEVAGYDKFICSECGVEFTEVIDALGHTPIAETYREGYLPVENAAPVRLMGLMAVENNGYNELLAEAPEEGAIKYAKFTCSCCREEIVEPIDCHGEHVIGVITGRIEPICTEKGTLTYTCSKCGETGVTKDINPLGHAFVLGEHVEETGAKATCSSGEQMTYAEWICTACGVTETINRAGAVKDFSNHSRNDAGYKEVLAPTCTTYGVEVYMCSGCYTTANKALLKNYAKKSVEALVTYCQNQGIKYRLVDYTGHEFVETEVIPEGRNKCVDETYIHMECSCGNIAHKAVEPLGHEPVEVADDEYLVHEANCTEPTVYNVHCDRCGESIISEDGTIETFTSGEALGHNIRVYDICYNGCYYHDIVEIDTECKRCGVDIGLYGTSKLRNIDYSRMEAECILDELDQVALDWLTEEEIAAIYTDCENIELYEIVEDTGKRGTIKIAYSDITDVDDCVHGNIVNRTIVCECCRAPFDVLGTTVVRASGHDMEHITAVEATCENDGNISYYVCKRCGNKYSDDDGAVAVSDEEVVIPASHSFIHHEAKDSTCTVNGNIEYWTCSKCNRIFSDAYGRNEISIGDTIRELAAHKFTKYMYNNDAKCGINGTETATCDVCEQATDTRVKEGTALGHNYVFDDIEWSTDKQSVKAVYVCANAECGDVRRIDAVVTDGRVLSKASTNSKGSLEKIATAVNPTTNGIDIATTTIDIEKAVFELSSTSVNFIKGNSTTVSITSNTSNGNIHVDSITSGITVSLAGSIITVSGNDEGTYSFKVVSEATDKYEAAEISVTVTVKKDHVCAFTLVNYEWSGNYATKANGKCSCGDTAVAYPTRTSSSSYSASYCFGYSGTTYYTYFAETWAGTATKSSSYQVGHIGSEISDGNGYSGTCSSYGFSGSTHCSKCGSTVSSGYSTGKVANSHEGPFTYNRTDGTYDYYKCSACGDTAGKKEPHTHAYTYGTTPVESATCQHGNRTQGVCKCGLAGGTIKDDGKKVDHEFTIKEATKTKCYSCKYGCKTYKGHASLAANSTYCKYCSDCGYNNNGETHTPGSLSDLTQYGTSKHKGKSNCTKCGYAMGTVTETCSKSRKTIVNDGIPGHHAEYTCKCGRSMGADARVSHTVKSYSDTFSRGSCGTGYHKNVTSWVCTEGCTWQTGEVVKCSYVDYTYRSNNNGTHKVSATCKRCNSTDVLSTKEECRDSGNGRCMCGYRGPFRNNLQSIGDTISTNGFVKSIGDLDTAGVTSIGEISDTFDDTEYTYEFDDNDENIIRLLEELYAGREISGEIELISCENGFTTELHEGDAEFEYAQGEE